MKSLAAVLVVCVLFFGTITAVAQSDRGAITGRVTDASGAVIPGASVKVTNVATGAVTELTSDGEGRYVTANVLKPGTYKVQATRSGFQGAQVNDIVLNIGDVREVNVKLATGGAAETVNVSAEAQQLDTETSSRGEVITGRQIVELPLKDRNFTSLATLTPGVVRVSAGILSDATMQNQGDANAGTLPGGSDSRGSSESARFSRSGGASISANGLRATQNNYTLDGVDNNEPQFGTIGVFPNPDAIQEFKVETSVPKAETGRGGATINTTYQSGANAFHGSGYFYGQNDALNATHPELKRQRADLVQNQGDTPAQALALVPKSQILVREFGGTIGGPIIRNRTFFFGDYLGQRNDIPNFFSSVVPTAKSRIGDFSEFSTPVIDPVTGTQFMGCDGLHPNVICNLQSRPDFSPQAFKLLSDYPLPNVNVLNPTNSLGKYNFLGTRANQETINSFDVKIDHRLTTNNNLTGRYSFSDQTRARANFFPKLPTAGFGAGNEIGNTRQISISDTHTFKPTLLNEFRFGYTDIGIGIYNCGVGGACGVSPTYCKDIGIPNCNNGSLAASGGALIGGFGNGFLEFTGDGGLFLVKSHNYYIADSVTVVQGKNTWKAGVELRPRFLDTIDAGRSGSLKGNFAYGDGGTGNAQANMLLSQNVGVSVGVINPNDKPFNLRSTEWSLYVQDDYKATQQLTFNFGLRYDVFPNWTEANGRLANYDLASNQIVVAKGSGDSILKTDHNNFGPRMGFAYNFGPRRQYVIRGGYGVLYSLDGVDKPPLTSNEPWTVQFNAQSNLTQGVPIAPAGATSTTITPGLTLYSAQSNASTALIQQRNLTFQWQIANNWSLDVGYAGTRATNLLATRQLGNNNAGLGAVVAPGGGFVGDVRSYEDRGHSWYDGLQAALQKRFAAGFMGQVSYTWSHTLDDSPGSFNQPGDQRPDNIPSPVDPLDLGLDKGNSSLDRRQSFIANAIYDLPFGKGKRWGSNWNGGADRILGGWQANLIYNAQTGQPFSVLANNTLAVRTKAPLHGLTPGQYLNTQAFANPGSTTGNGTSCVYNLAGKLICFGDTRRNEFYGPGFGRTDLSFFKNTTITEGTRVQTGIEFFNLFNHANYIIPQNQVGNGDFGQFRTAMPGRTVQYRVKFLF